MAAQRYSSSGFRSDRHGLTIVQSVFALSVIAGLMFVTVRLMSMGRPAYLTQPIQTETAVVTTEAPPPVPETSETKAP
jgi:hypothetical protein